MFTCIEYSYFFFYGIVRNTYIKRRTKPGAKPSPLSTAVELSLGAVAGALAQIFTLPVSVIATRQQIATNVAKAAASTEDTEQVPLVVGAELSVYDGSFLAVAREIIHEDGITGLWSGLRPGLVLTVNPAITYGVFERVKSIFTLGDPTVKLEPWLSFYVGALSKALATIVSNYIYSW
jgi:adenine nucleotide transporter 17